MQCNSDNEHEEKKMTKEEVLEWIRQQTIEVLEKFSDAYAKPFKDFCEYGDEQ